MVFINDNYHNDEHDNDDIHDDSNSFDTEVQG